MTNKQLEEKIKLLEERVRVLEYRQVVVYQPCYPQPQPGGTTPFYPNYPTYPVCTNQAK